MLLHSCEQENHLLLQGSVASFTAPLSLCDDFMSDNCMMLRRWGPWDGSGMWSLSVNPAVSLDCSILVDGESPQNRGTQNVTSVLKKPTVFWDVVSREKALKRETKPGLWPPNCLSYRVLEAIAPEYRGGKAGVRLGPGGRRSIYSREAGREILLICVNVLLSPCPFWAHFQALISLSPRDTQPGCFHTRQGSRPGWRTWLPWIQTSWTASWGSENLP